MSSDPKVYDLIDKAADRLGWVVWSLNEKKEDSIITVKALKYLCNLLTHRMEGDTIITTMGSHVLRDDEIVPTLKDALKYIDQAKDAIKEIEGESSDYEECMLAIPDIQEAIRIREAGSDL